MFWRWPVQCSFWFVSYFSFSRSHHEQIHQGHGHYRRHAASGPLWPHTGIRPTRWTMWYNITDLYIHTQIYFFCLTQQLIILFFPLTPADIDCYGCHLHCLHHAAIHLHCCYSFGCYFCCSQEVLSTNWTATQTTGSWRWDWGPCVSVCGFYIFVLCFCL